MSTLPASLLEEAQRAERRGDVTGACRMLERALGLAKDPATRGLVHERLAIHFARRCSWRRMNEHEEASARSYAELRGAMVLAEAISQVRGGIEAFGARDEAAGLIALRAAHPRLVDTLGWSHPYTQQTANTLAHRLGPTGATAERRALFERLVDEAERIFGASHPRTLAWVLDAAYLQRAMGEILRAIASFERACTGLLRGPRRDRALEAFRALAASYRELGEPERIAPIEDAVLASASEDDDVAFGHVREARLHRDPAIRSAFNRACIEHAAPYVPRVEADVRIALDDTIPPDDRYARVKAVAKSVDGAQARMLEAALALLDDDPDARPDAPTFFVLAAMEALDDARGISDDGLWHAERRWQHELFATLWSQR